MILLNKAPGLTSFKSLGAIKRILQTKKVGHAGTLDQFASGLMIVCVGEATRLLPWFVGMDKIYRAVVHFGVETSTLDPEGEIVARGPVPSLPEIQSVLALFTGQIDQVPPKYSAIHIEGKRAYERVLAGEEFDMPTRKVCISSLGVVDWNSPYCTLNIACSSGTYIRSLARDIARSIGSCAHVTALSRESIGPFSLSQSVVAENCSASLITGRGLASNMGLGGCLEIKESKYDDFMNGKPLNKDFFETIPAFSEENQEGSVFPALYNNKIHGMIRFYSDEKATYVNVFPHGI